MSPRHETLNPPSPLMSHNKKNEIVKSQEQMYNLPKVKKITPSGMHINEPQDPSMVNLKPADISDT